MKFVKFCSKLKVLNSLQKRTESPMEADAAAVYTCRICLDESVNRFDFIAPCNCKGSSQYVHRDCLDKWRSAREDKAFSKCTECLREYKLISRVHHDGSSRNTRRLRYCYYITRDFSITIGLTQACIISLGLLFYWFDRSHYLLEAFHMQDHIRVFYYLCGFTLFLSLVGLLFTCNGCKMYYTNDFNRCLNSCNNCCRNCSGPDCGPVYVYNDPICCCPNTVEGCSCGECGSCCASAELGQECLGVLLVLVVVFALIGVFVCLILGVSYIQYLIQKHVHVLHKFTLSKDYIVADLSPDALSVEGDVVNDAPVEDDIEMNGLYYRVNTIDRDVAVPSAPPLTPSSQQYNELRQLGLV